MIVIVCELLCQSLASTSTVACVRPVISITPPSSATGWQRLWSAMLKDVTQFCHPEGVRYSPIAQVGGVVGGGRPPRRSSRPSAPAAVGLALLDDDRDAHAAGGIGGAPAGDGDGDAAVGGGDAERDGRGVGGVRGDGREDGVHPQARVDVTGLHAGRNTSCWATCSC